MERAAQLERRPPARGAAREPDELIGDYDGPIDGIVEFLRRKVRPDDVVAMVYGDLPVKFYTNLRGISGLTREDPREHRFRSAQTARRVEIWGRRR